MTREGPIGGPSASWGGGRGGNSALGRKERRGTGGQEDYTFGGKELEEEGDWGWGRVLKQESSEKRLLCSLSGSPGRRERLKVQQEDLGLLSWGRPREFPSPSSPSSLGEEEHFKNMN